MRAALLPTPGDPFLLAYWLRNFETWRDQVDELLVLVNGQSDREPGAYCERIVTEAGGRCVTTPARIGHDRALRWLLNHTDADHVVLCEDDAYVRHSEAVGEAFRKIESGETDLVGSPRHEDYFGQWVDFPPYKAGDLAELRRGLWPAFLFARRFELLATDQEFGDKAWSVGQEITGWGTVTPEACKFVGIAPDYLHLDTLFGTTFQLRAAGLRTELVHHVRLFDAKATEEWLAEDPPWFHITGLSTLDYILDRREDIPDLAPGGGLWMRRLAWWLHVWFLGMDARADLPSYRDAYLEALRAFMERANVSSEDMTQWTDRFAAWERLAVPA